MSPPSCTGLEPSRAIPPRSISFFPVWRAGMRRQARRAVAWVARADRRVLCVADALFEVPRLAELYDPLDPDRSDLDAYAALTDEFGASTVLDIGCGTGAFACQLAGRGLDVIAVDPAAASLGVARRKPGPLGAHGRHDPAPRAGGSGHHDRERGPGLRDRQRVGGGAAGGA